MCPAAADATLPPLAAGAAAAGYSGATSGAPGQEKRHGLGRQVFANGDVYEGEWQGDAIHGRGRYQYPSGASYEGGFDGHARHGRGRYVAPGGDVYDGDWVQGRRTGTATILYGGEDSGESYVGDVQDGMRHGKGVYRYPDGSTYDGQWAGGMKEGRGVFTFPNGAAYAGTWKRNHPDGRGVFAWEGGQRCEGAVTRGAFADSPEARVLAAARHRLLPAGGGGASSAAHRPPGSFSRDASGTRHAQRWFTKTAPSKRKPPAAPSANSGLGIGIGEPIGSMPLSARVVKVAPGMPAQRAGLQRGDLVTRWNAEAVSCRDDFLGHARALPPGASAELTLLRAGETLTLTITADSTAPPAPAAAPSAEEAAAAEQRRQSLLEKERDAGRRAERRRSGELEFAGRAALEKEQRAARQDLATAERRQSEAFRLAARHRQAVAEDEAEQRADLDAAERDARDSLARAADDSARAVARLERQRGELESQEAAWRSALREDCDNSLAGLLRAEIASRQHRDAAAAAAAAADAQAAEREAAAGRMALRLGLAEEGERGALELAALEGVQLRRLLTAEALHAVAARREIENRGALLDAEDIQRTQMDKAEAADRDSLRAAALRGRRQLANLQLFQQCSAEEDAARRHNVAQEAAERRGIVEQRRDGVEAARGRQLQRERSAADSAVVQAAREKLGKIRGGLAMAIADFGEPGSSRCKVVAVRPGGPAAAAGVHRADVLLSLGGAPVRAKTDFLQTARALAPGDQVELRVERDGAELHFDVRVAATVSEADFRLLHAVVSGQTTVATAGEGLMDRVQSITPGKDVCAW